MPTDTMRVFVYLLALMTGLSASQAAHVSGRAGDAALPEAANAAVAVAQPAVSESENAASSHYFSASMPATPPKYGQQMAVSEPLAPKAATIYRGDRARE